MHHGVSIKPKAGTLILFPSTELYPHEVTAITSGGRYTITLFLSNKGMIDMFNRLYKVASARSDLERSKDEF
jgi:predicted 2-oxoglutarate/Fe(II)-dependent dioxygenase YbiX